MDQLIERVLAVRAGFAPINRAGLVIHLLAVERDVFAVALHRQLLEVRGKAFQVLLVRQHRHGFRAQKIRVPNREQSHEHRQILRKRCGAEMFVHFVKPREHRAIMLRPDGQHRRKADGRIHRVAPADPVPEAEHVGRINAESRKLFRRWSRRRRNVSPRLWDFRRVLSAASRARFRHWSSSPAW